jgi:adenine specific DNA methylase Mod
MPAFENKLFYGDNLAVLRESIADESIDLIYLDPPFNSNASYNLLFKSPLGVQSSAQIEAFEDTWRWGMEAEDAFDQVIRSGNTSASDMLRSMRTFLGDSDVMAYLAMMAIRLIELHRVLRETGSLYLHCDPTSSHYLNLERILAASSKEGGVVLDPFCGCGTTIHAAQKTNRNWVGIDITHLAISLIEKRLKDAFSGIAFGVHGTPEDLDGARDLALRDKYQFQWWALSLVEAQPFSGKKKGADGGIDGLIYFKSGTKATERAIVSVKGGENINVQMIRDLKGVLGREKAPIGVFLTLAPATRPMQTEAASAGFYDLGGRQYPRLQIITIEQALNGVKPAIPLIDTGAAFKQAVREHQATQGRLDL